MEIVPSNIEVCLKLNRFVCGDEENDVVALADSRVRILSSHELATVTTVSFLDGKPSTSSLPTPKQHSQRDRQRSILSSASEARDNDHQRENKSSVFIDGTVEEVPKRKPSKFLQLLNQERKDRWSSDQTLLPPDGTGPIEKESSSRLHKGMHSPPKFEHGTHNLNPLRQEQLVAKQIRDEMFMDILAQQRNQSCPDNTSQVSAMSAKERILKTGHATGIPDSLRQL